MYGPCTWTNSPSPFPTEYGHMYYMFQEPVQRFLPVLCTTNPSQLMPAYDSSSGWQKQLPGVSSYRQLHIERVFCSDGSSFSYSCSEHLGITKRKPSEYASTLVDPEARTRTVFVIILCHCKSASGKIHNAKNAKKTAGITEINEVLIR